MHGYLLTNRSIYTLTKIALGVFLLLPSTVYASAVEWRWIPTLSGLPILVQQIVPEVVREYEEVFDISSYVFARVKRLPIREEYVEHIYSMAAKYGVSEEQMTKTLVCESGLTQYGDGQWGLLQGKAGELGIAQFKISTFIGFELEFDRLDLTIRDPFDQIEMMAIAFANGKHNHWSCYMKFFNYALYRKYFF